jgi:hypothetical protein
MHVPRSPFFEALLFLKCSRDITKLWISYHIVSLFAKMMNPYNKEMNPLDKPGPSASFSSAASTAGHMDDSTSLSKQKKKATNYINQYLREDEYLPNSIDKLTDEHIEGKHLKNFMENFGDWLARTKFDAKQKTSLGNKTKEEYFRRQKRY